MSVLLPNWSDIRSYSIIRVYRLYNIAFGTITIIDALGVLIHSAFPWQTMPHFYEHAMKCGGGECVFISINCTRTIIVSMGRVLIWGSLYLDAHMESDLFIRRGATPRLCTDRLRYLTAKYRSNALNTIGRRWMHKLLPLPDSWGGFGTSHSSVVLWC